MADSTPGSPAPEQGDGKPKKQTARKKAATRTSKSPTASSSAAAPGDAVVSAAPEPAAAEARSPEVAATPDPEPAPASAASRPPVASAPAAPARDRSVLDGVRDNPVGPLAAGLLVAIAVGLLLSVLVPEDPSTLAMAILGALLAAAVGFAVRYLSHDRGVRRQVEAFIATVVGVHLMSVTGAVSGDIPLLSQVGVSGPGFNEALIVAFATPPLSTGAVVAGLAAVIVVGWAGHRENRRGQSR